MIGEDLAEAAAIKGMGNVVDWQTWFLLRDIIAAIAIIALIIFVAGLFQKISFWLKGGPSAPEIHKKRNLPRAFMNVVLQLTIYERSKLTRWVAHILVFLSVMLVILTHPWIFVLREQYYLVVAFVMLFVGTAIMLGRRIFIKAIRIETDAGHWIPLILLMVIGVTGLEITLKLDIYYPYWWTVHALAALAFFAYIPYSNLLHMITSPITVARRRGAYE